MQRPLDPGRTDDGNSRGALSAAEVWPATANQPGESWTGPRGRLPDWTSTQNAPLGPRQTVTRYLTVPVALDATIVEISVSAESLDRSGVRILAPDALTYRSR
jgi:hypothetical protein